MRAFIYVLSFGALQSTAHAFKCLPPMVQTKDGSWDFESINTLKCTHLYVQSNDIGDAGAKQLAIALRGNQNLLIANLADGNIGPDGITALGKVLETNNVVLDSLVLGGNEVGQQGARHLARALQKNTHLKALHLSGCKLGDSGVLELVQGLPHNEHLLGLSISNNTIGLTGYLALGKALQAGMSLTSLELSNNRGTSQGAGELAKGLKHNLQLKRLILFNNSIGNDGAVALGRALLENHGLQMLELGANGIDDNGVQQLAKDLRKNFGLQTLGLRNNLITSKGVDLILSALERNTVISKVSLQNNRFNETTDDNALALAQLLKGPKVDTDLALRKLPKSPEAQRTLKAMKETAARRANRMKREAAEEEKEALQKIMETQRVGALPQKIVKRRKEIKEKITRAHRMAVAAAEEEKKTLQNLMEKQRANNTLHRALKRRKETVERITRAQKREAEERRKREAAAAAAALQEQKTNEEFKNYFKKEFGIKLEISTPQQRNREAAERRKQEEAAAADKAMTASKKNAEVNVRASFTETDLNLSEAKENQQNKTRQHRVLRDVPRFEFLIRRARLLLAALESKAAEKTKHELLFEALASPLPRPPFEWYPIAERLEHARIHRRWIQQEFIAYVKSTANQTGDAEDGLGIDFPIEELSEDFLSQGGGLKFGKFSINLLQRIEELGKSIAMRLNAYLSRYHPDAYHPEYLEEQRNKLAKIDGVLSDAALLKKQGFTVDWS